MQDLIGGTPADWIVVGWFTPDYRPLAEKFAANLSQHNAPYHLFARAKTTAGWSAMQKPAVVLDAMRAHPSKTLVLMDVDCIILDDIAPVAGISGDVAITVKPRRVRLMWPPNRRLTLKAISRVVVFRPTDGARRFAETWKRICEVSPEFGDEDALARAFLSCHGAAISHLDSHYAGEEVPATPHHIVVHDSAHERQRRQSLMGSLKAIERRLRTGSTKLAKQAGVG
jgi:hypothetical protein